MADVTTMTDESLAGDLEIIQASLDGTANDWQDFLKGTLSFSGWKLKAVEEGWYPDEERLKREVDADRERTTRYRDALVAEIARRKTA